MASFDLKLHSSANTLLFFFFLQKKNQAYREVANMFLQLYLLKDPFTAQVGSSTQ